MFRITFRRNLAPTIPVFSAQIQDWFDYTWSFPGSQWIAPVLGTVIYLYGSKPFWCRSPKRSTSSSGGNSQR